MLLAALVAEFGCSESSLAPRVRRSPTPMFHVEQILTGRLGSPRSTWNIGPGLCGHAGPSAAKSAILRPIHPANSLISTSNVSEQES